MNLFFSICGSTSLVHMVSVLYVILLFTTKDPLEGFINRQKSHFLVHKQTSISGPGVVNFVLFFLETGSYYKAQAGLKLGIFLPLPPGH